jgi:1-aminocyclopropane-1-carboxylate deaminase
MWSSGERCLCRFSTEDLCPISWNRSAAEAEAQRNHMALNLEKRFERYRLGYLPSPIHRLDRLSRELGTTIWAKRDDVSSGLAFGGNKIRKLEWLVPDVLRTGCDTLVSIGHIQSNHTRQVAAVAAVLGLKCRLVQESWTKWDDPVYDKVGNILLSRLMGAETLLEGEGYSTAVKKTWEQALEQVRREGGTPYAIPAGASDHPLGGLGYANFADEIEQQEDQLGLFFDTIVTATATGSTQAGMVVGFRAQERERRLIGIDTAADVELTRRAVTKIALATAELIGLKRDICTQDIVIESQFSGPAYGIPDEATIEAIRLTARLEGIITDPVYEGKSIAGLIQMVRSGEISRRSQVLYVHLGGAPAINAYYKVFENIPTTRRSEVTQ